MKLCWGPLRKWEGHLSAPTVSCIPLVRQHALRQALNGHFTSLMTVFTTSPISCFLYQMCPSLPETWAREIAHIPIYYPLLFLSLYCPAYHPKSGFSISCFCVPPFSKRAFLYLESFLNSSVCSHSYAQNIAFKHKLFKKRPENTDYCQPWEKKVTLNILCLNTLPLASAAGLRCGTRLQRPLICSIGYYVLTLTSATSLPNTVFWEGTQAAVSWAIGHWLLP